MTTREQTPKKDDNPVPMKRPRRDKVAYDEKEEDRGRMALTLDKDPFQALIRQLAEEKLSAAAVLAIIQAWNTNTEDGYMALPKEGVMTLLRQFNDLLQIPLPDSVLVYSHDRLCLRHESGSEMSCKGDNAAQCITRAANLLKDSSVNPAHGRIVFGAAMTEFLSLLIMAIDSDMCPAIVAAPAWTSLLDYVAAATALVHLQAKFPNAGWTSGRSPSYYALSCRPNPSSTQRMQMLFDSNQSHGVLIGKKLPQSEELSRPRDRFFEAGQTENTNLAGHLVTLAENLMKDIPLIQEWFNHALNPPQHGYTVVRFAAKTKHGYFTGGLALEQAVNQRMLGRLSVSMSSGPALVRGKTKDAPRKLSENRHTNYLGIQSHVTGAFYGPFDMGPVTICHLLPFIFPIIKT